MGKETLLPEEVRPKALKRTQRKYLNLSKGLYASYERLGSVEGILSGGALITRIEGLIRQNPKPEDLKKVKQSFDCT